MPAKTAPTTATTDVDPFAGMTAVAVDAFPTSASGRVRAPFSPTVVAFVRDSWNKGETPIANQVPVGNEVNANALKRELARVAKYAKDAGINDDALTILTKLSDDKKTLTFIARRAILRPRKTEGEAATANG